MNNSTEAIMKRVEEHHQEAISLGYEVVGTFLQGSFNYGGGMSDEQSDVDTKCLVLPSFEDVCLNRKPVSFTHMRENNEHIDIKDIRLYIECFRKQNINFVEILFTEFKIINPKYAVPMQKLIEARENIGRYNVEAALNCMVGMALEKLKALEHPYPATKAKIDKYGFDGKQLSHILRLDEFMGKYMAGVPYEKCLISNQQSRLLDIKRNRNIVLEEARQLASDYSASMKKTRNKYLKGKVFSKDEEIDTLFDEFLVDCMKINFGR